MTRGRTLAGYGLGAGLVLGVSAAELAPFPVAYALACAGAALAFFCLGRLSSS